MHKYNFISVKISFSIKNKAGKFIWTRTRNDERIMLENEFENRIKRGKKHGATSNCHFINQNATSALQNLFIIDFRLFFSFSLLSCWIYVVVIGDMSAALACLPFFFFFSLTFWCVNHFIQYMYVKNSIKWVNEWIKERKKTIVLFLNLPLGIAPNVQSHRFFLLPSCYAVLRCHISSLESSSAILNACQRNRNVGNEKCIRGSYGTHIPYVHCCVYVCMLKIDSAMR